jgi:hypothetical protein
MARHFILTLAAASFLSGCAIHPLPEDVTGVDTYHIVRQIRCEAREAATQALIRWLRRLTESPDPRLAQQARDLADLYETNRNAVISFKPEIFKGNENQYVRALARLFYDTGIAYNFDLTMTEDNNLSADFSFLKPLTNPKFTLGGTAGHSRKRSNNRTFTVTDTFHGLLVTLSTPVDGHYYCDGQLVSANYIYPIAGRIGLDNMVLDFVRLSLFTGVAEDKAKPGASGAPTMADKLSFTTTIGGSATPTVVFAPFGDAFQFTNASLTATLGRTDLHTVTVGLALPASDVAELGALRSFLFSRERSTVGAAGRSAVRGRPPVVVGARVTGNANTRAEELAIQAVDQLKSRELQFIPPP